MYLEKIERNNEIKPKGIKRFGKYIFRVLIFIVFILLIGFSYEKIGEYKDNKNYLPAGNMVDVNNHKINVYTKGKGDVTVVFSSGLATPSSYAQLYPLYNEISKYGKVAVYDRPGHGWSDVTDQPRDRFYCKRNAHCTYRIGAKTSIHISRAFICVITDDKVCTGL